MATFFIAVLSGILGLFCGGAIAVLCVDWFHVSNFEGKASYFIVLVALVGAVAAFVLGLVVAGMAASRSLGFLKELGAALGAVLVTSLVTLAICWLMADIPPSLRGQSLELDIEVQCPKDFRIPEVDQYGATAEVYVPKGRRLPIDNLRLDQARMVDGRLIVTATVPLTTSASNKYLSVRFSTEHNLLFNLPLRAHPRESDLDWSAWVESGWDADKPEPPADAKFRARYRVRLVEPAPPAPDPETEQAAAFAALASDAPLAAWLPFLFDRPTADRTRVVVAHINAQQAELPQLIRDKETREHALSAAAYVETPSPELVESVLADGRAIAADIRALNALPATDPVFHDVLLDLRSRFNDWKQAWWTVSQRARVDARPPVQEIYDLATVRARGTAMDEIEGNARVILDQLNKTAAERTP